MKQNTTTPTTSGRADVFARFISTITTVALITTVAVCVLSAVATAFVAPLTAIGGSR